MQRLHKEKKLINKNKNVANNKSPFFHNDRFLDFSFCAVYRNEPIFVKKRNVC